MELSNKLDLFISALLSLIFSIFIVAKVFDKEIIKNKFKALGIISTYSFLQTATKLLVVPKSIPIIAI